MYKYLILFTLLPLISYSQITVTGEVNNQDGGKMEFVNITIYDQDSSIVNGTITDNTGSFELLLARGVYLLHVSFIGYESYVDQLTLEEENIHLGALLLKMKDQELEGVTISANKPIIESKIDRLVFNVENSVSASTGNLVEALRQAPRLNVSPNSIEIFGKGQVNALINGKPINLSGEELIQFLETINADDIKSIEVITTPPSKYEAGGAGGLINIIYKEGRRNAWSNSVGLYYLQGIHSRQVFSNSFNYSKNKFNASVNFSKVAGLLGMIETSDIYFPDSERAYEATTAMDRNAYSGRVQLGYEISDRNSVQIQYLGSYRTPDINGQDVGEIFYPQEKYMMYSNGNNEEVRQNHSFNFSYVHKFKDPQKQLSVDLDYLNYDQYQNRYLGSYTIGSDDDTLSTNETNSYGDQQIDNYHVKVDMVHPTSWAKISYGAKASFSIANTFFDEQIRTNRRLDIEQDQRYSYSEHIQALYIDATKSLTEKVNFKLGFRLENTLTESKATETIHNDYLKLFPVLYLSYAINKENFMSLSYNKRIGRPSFWELKPFRWYINPNFYSEGNPFLRPVYYDSYNLTYSFRNKLTANIDFVYAQDQYNVINILDAETEEQIVTRDNISNNYTTSLNVNYQLEYQRLQMVLNAGINYSKTMLFKDIGSEVFNGTNGWYSIINTFNINEEKTFMADVTIGGALPIHNGLITSTSGYYINFGVKKYLMDKKLQLTASINDIFNSNLRYFTSINNGNKQVASGYYDNRYFRFSVKYKFGNNKISDRSKSMGNQEALRRIN
ncbi:outer membrane beta-barrel protein [Flammeovirga sp. EKP202]|uniref:outer membrane beta-barrel protein n=1 Tax=Flammeovirga sp. EKP202 TaxID=2770592 RepID=UPI0016600593|nr:outer membrane beta-barrel protein [Flammeovirga sp. EKP202]MBD0402555.1 TonB-dependent receptor [Flammeovirga sp. EKP202]